jgi:hypothetical protein
MFWRKQTDLSSRLSGWLKAGGSLLDALGRGPNEVRTEREAQLVCQVLDQALCVTSIESYQDSEYNLHTAVAFFQDVAARPATDYLTDKGLPRLRALIRRFREPGEAQKNLVMLAAKMLAIYHRPQDVEIIADLARDPVFEGEWIWSIVFNLVGRRDDFALALVAALREPLPEKFCRVAFLDLAQRLANEGKLPSHPFDNPQGHAAMRAWLTSPNPDESSYAVSAVANLPFIAADVRNELLEIALRHPDRSLRIEAAWAQAKGGDSRGLNTLAGFATDPCVSKTAVNYLRELGSEHRIPGMSQDPDFLALAEMADWLAHPNEFGRSPDEISVADSRELYWPPTDDRRWLWVIKYGFRNESGEWDRGFGLTGSTTWAMFGEAKVTLPVLDVYAIHCCWELKANEDARAPSERSASAGRRLLAEHNAEFRLQSV